MSVLVTGGAGYVGSHAAKALAAAGLQPVVYDNMSRGHRWAVCWGPLIEGDIGDREHLLATMRAHQVTAVLHFAAFIEVGESVRDPGKYFRNNSANAVTLLDAMVEAGVRDIVFSSTAAVYGDPIEVPLVEDHPTNPVSPYGEAKLFVEHALRWYGQAHGLRWAALRYFNAAGADPAGELGEDHNPESHLIPLAIGAALGTRPPLKLFGTDYATRDGTAVRDYVHVSDLAEAHVLALRHLDAGAPSLIANLGTGHGHTVREVLAAVERAAGRPVPHDAAPRRPGDAPELVASPRRAMERLGWKPVHTELDAMVGHAWRWHTRGDRHAR